MNKHPRVYCNKEAKIIGALYYEGENRIYRKKVHTSKHLLRVMDAWGIDSDIVGGLKDEKCTEIRVKCLETDIVYMISFKEFLKYAVERDFVGKQMFVSRRYWTIKK